MSLEQEVIIDIDENDRNYASIWAKWLHNPETRTRAFTNALGADLGLKYLAINGIEVHRLHNMHTIRKVLGEIDVADIMLPNIHIDVRVIYNENYIFVPKSHFECDIKPDIYMVMKLEENNCSTSFIGFFEPKLINTNNSNEKYYFFEKEKLSASIDLKAFIENFEGNTDKFLNEETVDYAETLILKLIDDEINDEEKKHLLKLLCESDILREKFIEFENFELLSNKAQQELGIEQHEIEPFIFENSEEKVEFDDFTEYIPTQNEDLSIGISPSIEITDALDAALDTQKMLDNLYNFIDEDEDHDVKIDSFEPLEVPLPEPSIDYSEILEGTFDSTEELPIETAEFLSSDNETKLASLDDILPEIMDETFEQSEEEVEAIEAISFDEITETPMEENIEEFENETVSINEVEQEFEPQDEVFDNEIIETEVEEPSFEFSQENFDDGIFEDETYIEKEFDHSEIIEETDVMANSFESEMTDEQSETHIDEFMEETFETFVEPKINLVEELAQTLNEDIDLSELDKIEIEPLDIQEPAVEETFVEEPLLEEVFPIENEFVSEFEEVQNEVIEEETIENIEPEVEEEVFEAETSSDEEYVHDTISFDEMEIFDTDEPAEKEPIEPQELIDEFEYTPVISEEIIEDNSLEEILIKPAEPENHDEHDDDEFSESLSEIENFFDEQEDNKDQKLEVLYNEKDGAIGMGKLKELQETNEEPNSEPFLKFARKPEKRNIYILAAFVTIISCLIIYATLFRTKAPELTEETVLPENQSVQDSPLPIEAGDLNQNTPDLQPISKEDLQAAKQKPQELKTTSAIPKSNAVSGDYLTVSKISWEVPYYLSASESFRRYLQTAGKSVKLSLSSDLLLTSDYAYSNQVKVNLDLSKDGSVKNASIIISSGSDQIDNIVLQTVKDTLNVVKPPSAEVQGTNFHLVVIINF